MNWYDWKPYVPVPVRRANALVEMEKLRKKGLDIQPVKIDGRKIATTFWGQAWCNHLESFSDFENRLPRGRTYVRNGSVCHLDIAKGQVKAKVVGSEIYKVNVTIKTLARKKWTYVKNRSAGQIGSLLELLQGRLSKNVMKIVTNRNKGMFPLPGEITLECDCPDWAVMCKHVAAVLYGVGARLDEKPQLLFLLRGVDHEELIGAEVGVATAKTGKRGGRKRIAEETLADVFGIELSQEAPPAKAKRSRRGKQTASKSGKASSVAVKRKAKRPKTSAVAAKRKPKRKVKSLKSTTRVKKNPASRQPSAKRAPRATVKGASVIAGALAALKDEDWRVRFQATVALSEIDPVRKKSVHALITTLKDKDARVRRKVALALGRIGPPANKAVPDLTKALNDRAASVRAAAKEALKKINAKR